MTRGSSKSKFVGLALVFAVCASACTSSADESSDTAPEVSEPSEIETYETVGPFAVGITSLELAEPTQDDPDATREVLVWYPGDPGEVAAGEKEIFRISDLLPAEFQAIVPDDLNPELETDAVRDVKADLTDGPYPMMVFSHGFGAYPTEYQEQLAHAASWGFVVVAPYHVERGLLSLLGTQERVEIDEGEVMMNSADLARAEAQEESSLLAGALAPEGDVVVMGHSAGTGSSVQAATGERASEVLGSILMAGSGFRSEGTPPDSPVLFIAGDDDRVAELEGIEESFEAANDPKELVTFVGAGHLSMTDICVIGRDQGGLLQITEDIGLMSMLGDGAAAQVQALAGDGCTDEWVMAEEVWPATHHLTVAFLRWRFGLDDSPAALGTEVIDPLSEPETIVAGGF